MLLQERKDGDLKNFTGIWKTKEKGFEGEGRGGEGGWTC